MSGSRITVRFSSPELSELRRRAGEAGLPVGTMLKVLLLRGIQAETIEEQLERDDQARQQALSLQKRAMAMALEQTLILRELASKSGVPDKRQQALDSVAKLFTESGQEA